MIPTMTAEPKALMRNKKNKENNETAPEAVF
jgi:hypothetical protein